MHAVKAPAPVGLRSVRGVANLAELEHRAGRVLPPAMHHYVAGYVEDGESHRRNLRSFRRRAFIPRVLVDVSARSAATTLFGRSHPYPFGIAPMGSSRLIARDGDIVLAKAAAQASLPFVLSGASLTPMETVRAAGPTSWFQAYIPGEADRIAALLERVEAAGFDTLVVTVDTAAHGQHELAARHGFRFPARIDPGLVWQGATHPRWLWQVLLRDGLAGMKLRFENMDATAGPPVFSKTLVRDIGRRDALSWQDIATIRRRWRGKLVVKGVMAVADARRAQEEGTDGIVISNHGGRQIDCAVAALDALEAVAAEKLSLAVMYDGGIRRGSDVLKALRLGADFVFVGRPFLQAAAVGGEAGVSHALDLLGREIDLTMALLGIARLEALQDIAIRHDLASAA